MLDYGPASVSEVSLLTSARTSIIEFLQRGRPAALASFPSAAGVGNGSRSTDLDAKRQTPGDPGQHQAGNEGGNATILPVAQESASSSRARGRVPALGSRER